MILAEALDETERETRTPEHSLQEYDLEASERYGRGGRSYMLYACKEPADQVKKKKRFMPIKCVGSLEEF